MNIICLAGNIGQEPKITETSSGFTIAEFSVACRDKKKVDGEWTDHTEWVTVKCLGKTAELVDKYLGKGSKIGVQGKIQTDSWEKDGEKKYKTYVLCEKLEFLSSKGEVTKPESRESKELDLNDVPF